MQLSEGARRALAAALTATTLVGTGTGTALAGDQAIVNKGIGFLKMIQGQMQGNAWPCSAFAAELHNRHIDVPTTRENFSAGIERDAQERRDWIDKRSGGMTPEQWQQLETAISETRGPVMDKAERCGFFNTGGRPGGGGSGDTSAPVPDSPAPGAPAPAPKPRANHNAPTRKGPSDLEILNNVQKNLQEFNTNGGRGGPTARYQGARYTQLVIANPFDPSKPIVFAIPPFVPQQLLVSWVHMLPAGWALR